MLLERADVAAFAADDTALHVVGREVDDRDGRLHRVVGRQALDRRRQHLARLFARALARLLFEPHADQRGLAARLLLHLREQLPLGLFRGKARDGLELAALLVGGGGDACFALAEGPVTRGQGTVLLGRLGQAPIELIELARELLFLGEDALLDLLELALAAPGVLFESRAHLQRRLACLEVGRLADAVGFALTLGDDLLRSSRRVAEAPVREPLVEEDTDEQRQQSDQRVEPGQRVHHPSSRTRPLGVLEVRVRFDEYRWRARGESNAPTKSPRLCRVPWCFEPGMSRWASSMESFRLPLLRGACTPLSRSTPVL